MTPRRLAAMLLVPLLSGTLLACGGDDAGDGTTGADPSPLSAAGDAATVTVTVETFDFQPDPLEVEAGTVVRFENEDAIDHTVTAGTREAPTPDVFDGALPEQGSTFELTLDEPGTYDYFCRIHPGPGMTGSLTVR